MASARLRKFVGTIWSEYKILQRQSPILIANRPLANKSVPLRNTAEGEVKSNTPLKFTGSRAEAWKAQQTRSGNPVEQAPWYQQHVIFISLTTFMIYFFILREENDIDQQLSLTLYDHIEGLEEKQLEIALKYNQENGIDTKAIEARLKELRGQ